MGGERQTERSLTELERQRQGRTDTTRKRDSGYCFDPKPQISPTDRKQGGEDRKAAAREDLCPLVCVVWRTYLAMITSCLQILAEAFALINDLRLTARRLFPPPIFFPVPSVGVSVSTTL